MTDGRGSFGVLVTGGSAGIGLGIAQDLAKVGADLLLVSRDGQKLRRAKQQLQGEPGMSANVETFEGDMSDPDDIDGLFDSIAALCPPSTCSSPMQAPVQLSPLRRQNCKT